MDNPEDWKELFPIMKGVFKKLKTQWCKEMKDEYSINQLRLLQLLDRKSPMKSTELADLLLITPGAVTLMGDKLCERGLIRRYRSQEDRRVVKLELTEDGKLYTDTFKGNDEIVVKYIQNRLSPEDIGHLRRIVKLLDQDDKTEGKQINGG
ncbi:MarR family transcriptional regulator [Paenibacillus sp. N4]|uniref:MarR family winged helix-turn-helix transcriptional regulator n=1 Tax=Paenibacillus vietnamensis TaxID=2590547 RepID=UPI001CD0891D|nr:MarR family transcriptional regulator [Paenibacillus vietnamensis]MCA0754794.1 MarR family transcriptional regulator [Paenibacillus vietnamensis]